MDTNQTIIENTSTQPIIPDSIAKPTVTHTTYIKYTNTNLSHTGAERKEFSGASGKGSYYQISLKYNYGLDSSSVDDLIIEGCPMTSQIGIQSGAMGHSIMVKFDPTQEKDKIFLQAQQQFFLGCAYILNSVKGEVKMPLQSTNSEATGLINRIYYPFDTVTNTYVQGAKPSAFLK